MSTLVHALRHAAETSRAEHVFQKSDGTERRLRFDELFEEAQSYGAGLLAEGARPGDRIALIVPDPDAFVPAFLGALVAGLVPVPLYPPSSVIKLAAYGSTVSHVLRKAGAKLLLLPRSQRELLGELLMEAAPSTRIVELEALPREKRTLDHTPRPSDIALLQFTSGSTSAPKGVVVTHEQLAANGRSIMFDGLRASGEVDRGVSWLPLYHDMGLIGFVVAPIFAKVPVVFMPTSSFIRRPSSWLTAIHKHRGTITFAPNFAYALATRAIKDRNLAGWDLSSLRVAGCGAEPISAPVLRAFADRFAPAGFRETAFLPAYGMAEATLALSFSPLSRKLRTDRIDPRALEVGEAKPSTSESATEIVGCGVALPGTEIRIVGEDGSILEDRKVGEIVVRGPSIASGYFDDEETTREVFGGGFLRTGDLGYLDGGELFVSGRKKDLIILRGRNYFPQDIENVVAQIDGISEGGSVAFACKIPPSEEESLVIVAEASQREGRQQALEAAVKERVYESCGLVVGQLVIIRRGTLPRTSSGKVRRAETKQRFLEGRLSLSGERGDVVDHRGEAEG